MTGSTRGITLARVTSVRFAAYYATLMAAGLDPDRTGPAEVLLFAGYWLVFCVAVESLNRVADRAEDEINQPRRTELCRQVGYRVLLWVAICAWALVALLDVAWLVARPSWTLGVLLAVDFAVGVGYSAGPRLKAHRVAALLALTGTLSLPLLTGFASRPDRDRLTAVLVAVALVTLVSLTTAGAKDVTDEAGDRIRDYRSLWVEVIRRRRGLLAGLVALQCAIPVVVVATGTLPPSALLALVVVPLEVGVLVCVARAATAADKAAAREAMHTATLVVVGLVLLGVLPSRATAGAVAAGWAWWVLASRFLHWNRLLSRESLARCRALVLRPTPAVGPPDADASPPAGPVREAGPTDSVPARARSIR